MNCDSVSGWTSSSVLELLDKAFVARVAEYDRAKIAAGYAPPPETVYITLTNRCQCQCAMCSLGHKRGVAVYRDPAAISQLVTELASFDCFFVFYRQEPLLHPALDEILRIITNSGAQCQITTNGLLLSKKADEITANAVRKLWVSVDGPPDVHDRIRRVPGLFKKVEQGVFATAESRERANSKYPLTLGLSACVSGENYLHLPELFDLVSGWPIDYVVLNHLRFTTPEMVSASRANALGFSPKPSLREDSPLLKIDLGRFHEIMDYGKSVLGTALHEGPRLNDEALFRYYHSSGDVFAKVPCITSWFVTDIDIDGDLIQCGATHQVRTSPKPTESFMETWNGPEWRALRRTLLAQSPFSSCVRCSHLFNSADRLFQYLAI